MRGRAWFDGTPLAELIRYRASQHHLGIRAYIETLDGATTYRSYQRWSDGKPVLWFNADRVAIALGVHPAALWPHDWYAAA